MAELNETLKSEATSQVQKESREELQQLEEATNLIEKVSDFAKDVKQACQTITAGTGEEECTMEDREYLTIGKECVQPLIELKNTATEVFSNVKDTQVKMLNQPINVKTIEKHLDAMKTWSDESQGIISMCKLLVDSTEKLIDLQSNTKENGNINESCVSVASSDPSMSEFSLFENSTSAATSSPMNKMGDKQ